LPKQAMALKKGLREKTGVQQKADEIKASKNAQCTIRNSK